MARRKVESAEVPATETTPAPKTSAAERTLPLPLGQTTTEQRAEEIKNEQNDAVARAIERRKAEAEQAYEADERKAIQEESPKFTPEPGVFAHTPAPSTIMREEFKAPNPEAISALGGAFFGNTTPKQEAAPAPRVVERRGGVDLSTFGEEVTVTKGEEMYGKSGQFSTYRVGPFSMTTKVLPDETRPQAMRRAMNELNAFADEERENVKQRFLSHFPKAFG
jgi:hypothetical protein